MKICFICSEYPPLPHGGIGSYVFVMAKELCQLGHKVVVVGTYRGLRENITRELDGWARIVRLRTNSSKGGWILDRYRLYSMIKGMADQGEIDIVEAPDWGGDIAFWPKIKVPVVIKLHSSKTLRAIQSGRKRPLIESILESRALYRADSICAVSEDVASRTKAVFGLERDIIDIVYNPVRDDMSINHERKRNLVIYAGTVMEMKGIVSLIRAWPTVVRQVPEAELHVYGKNSPMRDGETMIEYLRNLLGNENGRSVHFEGHVDRPALIQCYQAATLAVFPSYYEAFAMAPMEAMAAGCPVIYTKRSSGPELIRNGIDGLLVDPDNIAEISDAIVTLLKDRKLAGRLGDAGALRIKTKFDCDAIMQKHLTFYHDSIRIHASKITNSPIQKKIV